MSAASCERPQRAGLTRDVYSRPMPEGSTAFWATVRHAFPNAMSDPREFETAAANLSLYIAAYETTSTAITHTLTALALDQDSQAALAEVRHRVSGLHCTCSGLLSQETPDISGTLCWKSSKRVTPARCTVSQADGDARGGCSACLVCHDEWRLVLLRHRGHLRRSDATPSPCMIA